MVPLCVAVSMSVAGCDRVFGLTAVADPEPDAATSMTCPDDYVARSTGRYRFGAVPTSWTMAELDCRDDRVDLSSDRYTHLVVLSTDAERDVVFTLGSAMPEDRIWVGLTDAVIEGDFRWVTGEDSTMNPRYPVANGGPPWLTGEPDDGGAGQDCVSVENSLLHDHVCTGLNRAYVCECDAFQ